jgi:hypothetical protein
MRLKPSHIGLFMATIAFTFFAFVMNIQSRDWLAWYHLASSGQATQAIITGLQPENHQGCSFQYTVNSRKYEGSEGGCHTSIGQSVQAIYLPSEPSFVTLKSPQSELILQILSAVILSALAGAVSAWQVHRRSRNTPNKALQPTSPLTRRRG